MEAIELLSAKRRDVDVIVPTSQVNSAVYVSRELFEADLRTGFRSEDEILRQVEVDAPRCVFEYDGRRRSSALGLPAPLLPLFTQSVMALPVILLHKVCGSVLCGRGPRVIRASANGNRVASKDLLVPTEDGTYGPVHAMVSVFEEDDFVRIDYMRPGRLSGGS